MSDPKIPTQRTTRFTPEESVAVASYLDRNGQSWQQLSLGLVMDLVRTGDTVRFLEFTPEEAKALQAKASDLGYTSAEYIRETLLAAARGEATAQSKPAERSKTNAKVSTGRGGGPGDAAAKGPTATPTNTPPRPEGAGWTRPEGGWSR